MYLNIELEGKEEENFLIAKEKSGIKSNTDFVRYIIKKFILKAHGSMPSLSNKFKVMNASDIEFDDPLSDDREIELSYRRGYIQGFVYRDSIKAEDYNQTLALLNDWRYKVPAESFYPAEMYIKERKENDDK